MDPLATPATSQPSEPAQVLPSERVRIISTPGVCGGRPRIDGHRITVDNIAVWHERMGMSPDEIVSAYPTLTLSDVHAALAYYYDHRAQMDALIREGEQFALEMKAMAPPSLLRQKLQSKGADAPHDPVSPR
jgi:uncharacterized protein (DUF433 family)